MLPSHIAVWQSYNHNNCYYSVPLLGSCKPLWFVLKHGVLVAVLVLQARYCCARSSASSTSRQLPAWTPQSCCRSTWQLPATPMNRYYWYYRWHCNWAALVLQLAAHLQCTAEIAVGRALACTAAALGTWRLHVTPQQVLLVLQTAGTAGVVAVPPCMHQACWLTEVVAYTCRNGARISAFLLLQPTAGAEWLLSKLWGGWLRAC